MSFTHPRNAHEEAQAEVRRCRDALHAVKARAADGRAEPHEVATAEYNLDTALQRLAFVQAEAADADGATA